VYVLKLTNNNPVQLNA